MAKLNKNYGKLSAGYLFPEIEKRTRVFLAENPGVKILRLGIGNTTEPLSPTVVEGLINGAKKLANIDTYTGYGKGEGDVRLRKAISDGYAKNNILLEEDEIFVSDGSKPDVGNIQSLFSEDNLVAVQDPAYPVYVDSNVIGGRTGEYNPAKDQYDGLVYMPCTEGNNFFPELPETKVDLIYICSPNNPTGMTATHGQLNGFVEYARVNRAVILFDAAYSEFITEEAYPKSIYEIEGAKECAIEINSFSKTAGFTGVRLGWAVVPKALVTEDGKPGRLNKMWNRRQNTLFNGASNVVQEGGLAALSENGRRESREVVAYYMNNARVIREGLSNLGFTVYGGVNAPYVWMKTPNGMKSWDFFDKMLQDAHVAGTPGVGFGPGGEGFFRLSAFGHARDIEAAVSAICDGVNV